MALSRLIIGDMHARRSHVADVLRQAGAIHNGAKNPDVVVTSLGDVVSLGYDEREAAFLEWIDPLVDEWLVGNHEAYALCPHPDLNFVGYDGEPYLNFNGKKIFPGKADPEAVAIVRRWSDEGRYKVASTCGPWLLTHAGLRPVLQKFYREHEADLVDIADDLNRRWRSCVAQPGMDDEFITPGSAHRGGILWQRFQHLRAGYQKTHLPQIVGHSADCGPALWRSGNLWCIDTVGGCAGLYTEDDGQTFRLLVSLPGDAVKPLHVPKQSWPPKTGVPYTLT
jgi:hypothetical protein